MQTCLNRNKIKTYRSTFNAETMLELGTNSFMSFQVFDSEEQTNLIIIMKSLRFNSLVFESF